MMTDRKDTISDIERRKFRRFSIPLDVQFKPVNDMSDYSLGEIVNFSRTGFCLKSDSIPFNMDDTVEFIVKLPTKKTFAPILGEIKWTRNSNDQFTAGISIKKMNKGDKCDILDSCYDLWLESARSGNISDDIIQS